MQRIGVQDTNKHPVSVGPGDLFRPKAWSLLTAAMFALGAGVRLTVPHGVGWGGGRPFALVAASTILVAAIALLGVFVG